MAGRGGGRPAAGSQEQTHHGPLGLQQRVLERLAGESLRQVNTFIYHETPDILFVSSKLQMILKETSVVLSYLL